MSLPTIDEGFSAHRVAARELMEDLYVRWASTPAVQRSLNDLVMDFMAAARQSAGHSQQRADDGVQGATAPRHADPQAPLAHMSGLGGDAAVASGARSPSSPGSPPVMRSAKREDRAAPAAVVSRIRVDELDSRSVSPGGSSPVSPNAATIRHAEAPLPLATHNDAASTPERDHLLIPHAYGRISPNNISLSSSNVPMLSGAGHLDIPTFYVKGDVAVADAPPDELAALTNAYVVRGKATQIDPSRLIRRDKFAEIAAAVFKIPMWLADLQHMRIAQTNNLPENAGLSYTHVRNHYNTISRLTPNRRLFELISGDAKREYLTLDDLRGAVRFLVDRHPGLDFLKQPEFQDFYCRTAAIRIMYELEIRQERRVTWSRFDRSDLPDVMRELDRAADINQVLRFFSYEHFYVLYCRFWELDEDRDLLLTIDDLRNYSGGTVTTSVLRRVVAGAGRKLTSPVPHKLDYEDFVYFCLSEEDKNSPAAVLYWFRVLDLDADGVLSGYELGQFFEEQAPRLPEVGIGEDVRFEDMLCQMLDMIGARRVSNHPIGLTIADLRTCETPATFFNMIFNAAKFSRFEHRDPFQEHQQRQLPERTDWDRFARLEYDRMASEVQQ